MKRDKFYNWLNTVEKVFTFEDLADHKKVTLIAINQSGRTDVWREQLQTSRQRMGGLPTISWEKIKKHLKGYFLTPTIDKHVMQLHYLQQGDRSVGDY